MYVSCESHLRQNLNVVAFGGGSPSGSGCRPHLDETRLFTAAAARHHPPSPLTLTCILTTTMAPQPTTEQSFRANLSQFRWAQSNTDDSQQSQANQPSSNPFSRFYNTVGGAYIPLRSSERSNEDEAYFALSRWERCVLDRVVKFWWLFGERLMGRIACGDGC